MDLSDSPFQPLIHTAIEQLWHLTKPQALGVWLTPFGDRHLQLFSSQAHHHASPFRRQPVTLTHLSSIPTNPKFITSDKAAPKLQSFLLKGAHFQQALPLVLQGSNQSAHGLILLLDPEEWPETKNVATSIVQQISQLWELGQQYQQLNSQLEEMADQNRQWQAMYNGVQESIVLLDPKAKILSLNPATERITGRKASEVIGKHIGELFPKVSPLGSGIDYPGRSGLYQTLEEKRPSDLFEAIVETKDKRYIWINYTYTPLWDSNGNMIALVRVTSDVSTVKAVEQMKNDFVSIASHELRTPLGVINGYLNLFLHGQLGQLTPDQQTFMERILHSSTDMSLLVEDLLNISRIEAGRLEITLEHFDLNQLILEVLNHLEPRYQAKSIHLKFTPAKPGLTLRADRRKVEQALTNIIDNAIKYTYDNGVVSIGTKAQNGLVSISIKDSGVGIKPEHLGHVFEKFYRENNPLSIKEGGSGLGLYISRKLIELHGGKITVTSKVGTGSSFTLYLPITAKKHSRGEMPARNESKYE